MGISAGECCFDIVGIKMRSEYYRIKLTGKLSHGVAVSCRSRQTATAKNFVSRL